MRGLAVAALLCAAAHGGDPVALRLDAKTTYQTWEGWSCLPNPAGFEKAFGAWLRNPAPETYDRVPMDRALPSKLIARMHDALVNDLGITRMRIEVGPQVEMVNDNADPRDTDAKAYRFAWQDDQIERHVLPMKQRIEARGEKMTLYVSYDLRSRLTPAFLLEPEGSVTSEPEKAFGRSLPRMTANEDGRLAIDLLPRSVTTVAAPES